MIIPHDTGCSISATASSLAFFPPEPFYDVVVSSIIMAVLEVVVLVIEILMLATIRQNGHLFAYFLEPIHYCTLSLFLPVNIFNALHFRMVCEAPAVVLFVE